MVVVDILCEYLASRGDVIPEQFSARALIPTLYFYHSETAFFDYTRKDHTTGYTIDSATSAVVA